MNRRILPLRNGSSLAELMFFRGDESSREAKFIKSIQSKHQLAKAILGRIEEVEHPSPSLILIADDEPLMFQLIEEFLTEGGIDCNIITALDGQEAYDLATSWVPDLVITDWLMPEMDGLDLIKNLKNNPITREIPVIMTTGMLANDEQLAAVLDTGGIDYIRKPLDCLELRARVKTALALNESILEIKEFKESITSKNQFVNFLVDTVPNPIFYMDRRGHFLGCNRNFEILFKKDHAEIIGRTADEIFPAELAAALDIHFSTLDTQGTVRSFEAEIAGDPGSNFIISYTVIGNPNERIMTGLVHDITHKVRSGKENMVLLQAAHQIEKEYFTSNLEKLQSELEFKHRELAMHLELLTHSRKAKEKLLEDVKGLQPFLSSEGKLKLFSLLKQLRWDLNDEKTLSIEKKFDEVHARLYATLEKNCPEITKNEKRLCAYLRMNHCASDIAKITDKTLNSINVGFARLRIKLGLPNNKDLKVFLSELEAAQTMDFIKST